MFASLLKSHAIRAVADIRTLPKSRRHPHFSDENLARALPDEGIAYLPMKPLGGLRKPRHDSPNGAWKNASFRGYADYMQTEAFERALDALVEASGSRRTAILCSEAVPWRCHRSLVADALAARGVPVLHILSEAPPKAHAITPFARVEAGRVSYPAD